MSKSKKTAGVPVAASSSVEQPRPGNGDELAANRARLVEPAADADRQLLQRALDAFKDIGYMHTAIAAQCGVLWQLA